jgi:hypothetical protein
VKALSCLVLSYQCKRPPRHYHLLSLASSASPTLIRNMNMLHWSSGKSGYSLAAPSIAITLEYQGNRQSVNVSQTIAFSQLQREAAQAFGLAADAIQLTHLGNDGQRTKITHTQATNTHVYAGSTVQVEVAEAAVALMAASNQPN